jgi:hypothetical protein
MAHPSDHHDHRGSATKMINGGAAGNKFRTGQRQRMHLNDSRSQQPQQPQSLPPYPVSILPTYRSNGLPVLEISHVFLSVCAYVFVEY